MRNTFGFAVLWVGVFLFLNTTSLYASEMTTFEFRITNNSSVDLTIRLDKQHDDHMTFSPRTDGKDRTVIKAGQSGTVVLTPTGHKCAPWCNSCQAAKARVVTMYEGPDGKLVDNNYFKATYWFSEYCDSNANKPTTDYSSNWEFEHHKGDGTDKYPHEQNHSAPVYTAYDPAKGNTFDASKTTAHANITYSDN